MTPFFRLYQFTFAIGLTLSVCACGQKGRLVIPSKPAAISTPYPAPVAKPANTPATDAEPTPAPTEQKVEAPVNPGSLFDHSK